MVCLETDRIFFCQSKPEKICLPISAYTPLQWSCHFQTGALSSNAGSNSSEMIRIRFKVKWQQLCSTHMELRVERLEFFHNREIFGEENIYLFTSCACMLTLKSMTFPSSTKIVKSLHYM